MNRSFLFLSALSFVVIPAASIQADNVVAGGPAKAKSDQYLAVAFSSSTKRYGYAYNCKSQADAERKALDYCGMNDARIVLSSKNQYLAIARGYNGATGWGSSNDPERAKAIALANCLRYSSYAKVVAYTYPKW